MPITSDHVERFDDFIRLIEQTPRVRQRAFLVHHISGNQLHACVTKEVSRAGVETELILVAKDLNWCRRFCFTMQKPLNVFQSVADVLRLAFDALEFLIIHRDHCGFEINPFGHGERRNELNAIAQVERKITDVT